MGQPPSSKFEFDGGFPRPHGCPRCGYFGFPDGFDLDGGELYFCDACNQSYEVPPSNEKEYWEAEDKYADWDNYY